MGLHSAVSNVVGRNRVLTLTKPICIIIIDIVLRIVNKLSRSHPISVSDSPLVQISAATHNEYFFSGKCCALCFQWITPSVLYYQNTL